jgi:hypothetical protein
MSHYKNEGVLKERSSMAPRSVRSAIADAKQRLQYSIEWLINLELLRASEGTLNR